MVSRPDSHPRSWLGRLSAVPLDPEEAQAFLQQRLRTYTGFLGLIWSLIFPVDLFLGMSKPTVAVDEVVRLYFGEPSSWLHLGTTVAIVGAWGLMRARRLSVELLMVIDLLATVAQGWTFGGIIAMGDPAHRQEFASMLGMANVLAVRAAIIPSEPGRTLAIGTASSAALIVGTAYLNATRAPAPGAPTLLEVVVAVSVWCAICVATTTLISTVTYGLRRRVRAALELGQYSLEQKIGEGGMGVVYRARHVLLRRPTAIKMLPVGRAGESQLAAFEREVRLTSTLSHPNIVAVYDYGRTEDGVFYYAMEYLDGFDLEYLVRQDGPQSAARVLYILKQAAAALDEAHAVGLIHRDIKPANMILCDRARQRDLIKVVDFGLVKTIAEPVDSMQTSDVSVVTGTPLYLAPESITNPEQVDARVDLYALGAVGYFLLSGRTVFEGDSMVDICSQHLYASVVPIRERIAREIPQKLEQVVLRCLEKNKERRYASAAGLLGALDACDDVAAWSDAHAAAWWSDRAPTLRATRPKQEAVSQTGQTIAIDYGGRA